jgi:hypothetical protein
MEVLFTPQKISNFCTNILSRFCINRPNPITIKNESSNPDRYFLQGGLLEIARGYHDQRIPIVLMNNGFWIHFSIIFDRKNNSKGNSHVFNGLSLQIYQDKGTIKQLLFRAEWDNIVKSEYAHPQPHWHFHPEKEFLIDRKGFNIESFKDYIDLLGEDDTFETELVERKSKKKEALASCHFAMLADWHINNSDIIQFSEQHLYNWLENCLKSIEMQLNYTFT